MSLKTNVDDPMLVLGWLGLVMEKAHDRPIGNKTIGCKHVRHHHCIPQFLPAWQRYQIFCLGSSFVTESGQWANFLSGLGDWWPTVTSLHTLWWVTVWRREAWKKKKEEAMGWPYDVVIQRGTCRFLLKITGGPDRNSSSISDVLFLLDASLLKEGGMAGWGCIVLFFIPSSLSKRRGKGSDGGSSWNLLSHVRRRPAVVSFTALRPSFTKSAVLFCSEASACQAQHCTC